jgi:hypothetical protein
VTDARGSRLDETAGDAVPIDGRRIEFTASSREVVTLLVR